MSSGRAAKRTAVAAAGFGMVLASFAGAAASATAATHHGPASTHRATPDINPVSAGITASIAAPVNIPLATARAGTATTLPTVTITDPGIIATTNVVTLSLQNHPADFGLTSTVPVVMPTGAGVTTGAVTVNQGDETIQFTVSKTTAGTPATFTVSGATVVGATAPNGGTTSGGFNLGVYVGTTGTGSGEANVAAVAAIGWGAVTSIIPAAYGAQAPDTAAVLFRAEEPGAPTSVVLASDYEPQDGESANFLADEEGTSILLTNPTTLSPAVTGVLNDYASIATVYIVGGTSVVSQAIETQLDGRYGPTHVVRIAGTDQYATNQFVVNYAAQQFGSPSADIAVDYTKQAQYNDTAGASSATTTAGGELKTAILVSGDIRSFQDGIVSGPLSYRAGGNAVAPGPDENLPVILTTPTTLSATALGLLTEGSYRQVIVLGGPLAVSDAVVGQLTASTDSGGAGVTVFRIAGTDASDTSTKLAKFLLTDVDTAMDFSPVDQEGGATGADGGVLIARGSGFQDALAAGPYAGDEGDTPILLTENATTLGAPLTAYLKAIASQYGVFAVQAIGGPLSVTAAVQKAASDAQFSGLTP